jgi:hypothetical protein
MRRRRGPAHPSQWLSPAARPAPLLLALLAALPTWSAAPARAAAAEPEPEPAQELPYYLADRGPGIPMSQFGTFVEPGEFLIYPFYEYTRTPVFEYHPSELGSVGGKDFNGKLFEREALLYLAYGISERLAFELEGALWAKTTFEKAPDDPSDLPARFSESGLGDVEGQLRWRWREETESRPELYSYFEVVLPLQRDKVLIGTQDWESALGFGALRGYAWGTIGGRIALAWDGEDQRLQLGEYALEYVKRTSDRWRFLAILEGESVEVSLITEAQWTVAPRAVLKLNCGFGLAEQSPDIAPEVGLMLHF